MEVITLPALEKDILDIQRFRIEGWQDNYQNPETRVTLEFLKSIGYDMPPKPEWIEFCKDTLLKSENQKNFLVAFLSHKPAGTLTYETLEDGSGYLGVFIGREYRGKGVGSKLLQQLISQTKKYTKSECFFKKYISTNTMASSGKIIISP